MREKFIIRHYSS